MIHKYIIYVIISYIYILYILLLITCTHRSFLYPLYLRSFVHHLKHIFMNHSYCFDETPLGQYTQVTRRYCRTWRPTPFSSSAVRLGDDENFPNIFLVFQIYLKTYHIIIYICMTTEMKVRLLNLQAIKYVSSMF